MGLEVAAVVRVLALGVVSPVPQEAVMVRWEAEPRCFPARGEVLCNRRLVVMAHSAEVFQTRQPNPMFSGGGGEWEIPWGWIGGGALVVGILILAPYAAPVVAKVGGGLLLRTGVVGAAAGLAK